jgi:hypothetical protein
MLEQLQYNLLFRWFVGLTPDDPIWHPTTFTMNRERLLNEEIMGRFLKKLIAAAEVKPLLSDEHLSVDGTLLQAWASHASLEPDRWAGRARRHRPHGLRARALVLQSQAKGERTATSGASGPATQPTAPAPIQTLCCA